MYYYHFVFNVIFVEWILSNVIVIIDSEIFHMFMSGTKGWVSNSEILASYSIYPVWFDFIEKVLNGAWEWLCGDLTDIWNHQIHDFQLSFSGRMHILTQHAIASGKSIYSCVREFFSQIQSIDIIDTSIDLYRMDLQEYQGNHAIGAFFRFSYEIQRYDKLCIKPSLRKPSSIGQIQIYAYVYRWNKVSNHFSIKGACYAVNFCINSSKRNNFKSIERSGPCWANTNQLNEEERKNKPKASFHQIIKFDKICFCFCCNTGRALLNVNCEYCGNVAVNTCYWPHGLYFNIDCCIYHLLSSNTNNKWTAKRRRSVRNPTIRDTSN